jgi:hypothetical protein
LHAVCVVFELQGVMLPVQVVDQLQPYSLLHVVELVLELHAGTVPVQVPDHEQPDA